MSAVGIRSPGGILSPFSCVEAGKAGGKQTHSPLFLRCLLPVLGDALPRPPCTHTAAHQAAGFLSHFMLILASSPSPEPAAVRCTDASPNTPRRVSTLLSPSAKLVISRKKDTSLF